jgi:hypothetical protein
MLANRTSAKSSRKRRLEEARALRDDLARLEDENRALREANITRCGSWRHKLLLLE